MFSVDVNLSGFREKLFPSLSSVYITDLFIWDSGLGIEIVYVL